ncbi:MAG TPA: DNA gyrase inhibitor YacG [Xanthobacteraceae bacterium]|jgi:endogenous inhibitor of DNA gyrase (YacG/DUF329 family)|nr:DNA gyrase inhibitor YacG [Xanthobacteraceae bacterium]
MTERDPSIVPETPCPICGKPRVQAYAPFCSKRCADVDLHRWLSGVYRIEGKPDEDEDGGPEAASLSPEED